MKNIEILLKNNIKKFGEISVESFFNMVLYHENYGYYKKSNIIGKVWRLHYSSRNKSNLW